MSKTQVHFLRKNRRRKTIKIKASVGYLEMEGGFYIVSPDAINRISKNGILTKGSELFFFEGNSSAIPIMKPENDAKDPSRKYLDDMVYVNFLEQTGAPKPEQFKSVLNFIKPVMNPANLFKLLLAILIVGTLLRGWITKFV
jgi:hypothetical protein